jgi:hypothetical protein
VHGRQHTVPSQVRVRTAGPDVVWVTVITPSTLGTVPAVTAAVATRYPDLETQHDVAVSCRRAAVNGAGHTLQRKSCHLDHRHAMMTKFMSLCHNLVGHLNGWQPALGARVSLWHGTTVTASAQLQARAEPQQAKTFKLPSSCCGIHCGSCSCHCFSWAASVTDGQPLSLSAVLLAQTVCIRSQS